MTDGEAVVAEWAAGEQELFWFWDSSHWPHPTTPLNATLELPAMAAGFTRAARALSRPFGDYHLKVVHGFVYFGFDLRNAVARAARAAACDRLLAQRIPDIRRYWAEEVLPEVQRINEHWQKTDWDHLSDAALASSLDDLERERARQWELHDLILPPAMAALDRFLALHARLFPTAPPSAAHALTRGLPNRTIETARALWELSRSEPVEKWVTGGGGGDLPAALVGYLDRYGWRTDGWELADPALREAPGPLLARLRGYLTGRHPDPERELARAAAERKRLLAQALALLPAGERTTFLAAHDAACTYPVLSEDHNFFIDQMGMASLRLPLLAMGRRLAGRAVLTSADDVFYLSRAELHDALNDGGPPYRALTAERRAARERRRGLRPPATLGAPLPDDLANDAVIAGFFGVGAEPARGERVFRGVAAAPGVARGPARLVRTLAESELLEPGDILVCPMTSPAWTPLFATAAAVVADAGGALSHTAIVAREFGLPCVVATRIACQELSDGEWIEVDGSAGEVRRLT